MPQNLTKHMQFVHYKERNALENTDLGIVAVYGAIAE
jgi:hypothetical protein